MLGTVTDVMTADEFESQALGNDLLEVELEPDPDDPQSKVTSLISWILTRKSLKWV